MKTHLNANLHRPNRNIPKKHHDMKKKKNTPNNANNTQFKDL